MDATDGNSITSKVEDELAVAVYTDDIAFASCKNAGEYTQLYMVFGKLLEWGSQKRYSFWIILQYCHEWLHNLVPDGGRNSLASVFHQVVLRIIIL